jgi:hypothetical protein
VTHMRKIQALKINVTVPARGTGLVGSAEEVMCDVIRRRAAMHLYTQTDAKETKRHPTPYTIHFESWEDNGACERRWRNKKVVAKTRGLDGSGGI